ncbi:hypothetical protein [Williamsia phyllosphaerae]|uniref:Uncharacterized protein n=1 Tax=Williamsia phyllosphaerae TaxID=885042 RepID=A0ABQ1UID2_9NOCA|nr:hypothetical protein [Williamsia phyllosphaerae]GGF18592.1 hypothetical protein GCM10007298_13240 [Williamsia phyllosphaerae]
MRTTRTTAIAGSAVALAAIAATALGTGTAAADTAANSPIYTLATNGACAGTFTSGLGHYPGQVDLGAQGYLVGVGPCSLGIDFVFTSRADGHVATFTRHLSGPGAIGLAGKDVVSPGKSGVYDVTVEPRAQFIGKQSFTFDTTYRP